MKVISCFENFEERPAQPNVLIGACSARINVEIDEAAHQIALNSDQDYLRAQLINSIKAQLFLGLVTLITASVDVTPKELIPLAMLIPAVYGICQTLRNRTHIKSAKRTLHDIGGAAKNLNLVENQLSLPFDDYQVRN